MQSALLKTSKTRMPPIAGFKKATPEIGVLRAFARTLYGWGRLRNSMGLS
jgi:hypothetical protein